MTVRSDGRGSTEYPREFLQKIQELKPQEQNVVKEFWRSVVMRSQSAFSEESGRLHGSNVRSCNCCPYGYHIDLDFVRYCESLAHAKPSEEQLRRRSRRRSRKSMEFMLGLEGLFDQWDAAERVQMVPEAALEMEPDSPNCSKNRQVVHHAIGNSLAMYEDRKNNNNNNNNIYSNVIDSRTTNNNNNNHHHYRQKNNKENALPPPAPPPRSSSVPRFTYGGLTPSSPSPPPPTTSSTSCSSRHEASELPPRRHPANSPPETHAFLHDALDEVCSDFERTLERASAKRKKAGYVVGGVGAGPSPGRIGSGGDGGDRNNNFMTSTPMPLSPLSPSCIKKRSCSTWEEYVDALDSCVSGNKSPRVSRLFTRSATLPLPPSPHKQQQQQQAQQQYESYVQATVAANAATSALQACIPPPPPPRRHLGRNRRPLTPDHNARSATLPQEAVADLTTAPLNTDGAAATTEAQTLFNIRQQMALSLKRMKDLEEQVKIIPELQNEISQLRDERQRLHASLQRKEDELQRVREATPHLSASPSPSPSASPKYAQSPASQFTPQRISPITLESLGTRLRTNSNSSERPAKATLMRDVGTMCLRQATRDMAVGTAGITWRTVGTQQALRPTPEVLYSRVELDEHVERALKEARKEERVLKQLISVGTQMYVPKRDVRDAAAQTAAERAPASYSVGVSVRPATRENFVTCRPDVRSVGCSEDRISDELCKQCAVSKRNVACGTDAIAVPLSPAKQPARDASLSLKLLDMPGRSNTFSLGDNEKVPLIKRKTVGTQYTPRTVHNAGAQTTLAAVHSVGVQNTPLMENSAVQCVIAEMATRQTDTRDLIRLHTTRTIKEEVAPPMPAIAKKVITKNSACNTDVPKTADHAVNTPPPAAVRNSASNTLPVTKRDFGCGDIVKPHISIACADNYCDSCKEAIKHLAKDFTKSGPPPVSPMSLRAVDSRIPRPTRDLTSPSPVRKKYQRQNTYTIPAKSPSPVAGEKRSSILGKNSNNSTGLEREKTGAILREANESERKADAISRLRLPSDNAAAVESAHTRTPFKTYQLGLDAGLDENLIVKEETCVRVSWSRAASPATLTPTQANDDDDADAVVFSQSSPSSLGLTGDKLSPSEQFENTSPAHTTRDVKSTSSYPELTQTNTSPMEPKRNAPEEQLFIRTAATAGRTASEKSSQSDVTDSTTDSTVVEVLLVPRESLEPSKEMMTALKIINDSLRRHSRSSSNSASQRVAKSTIQQEWFELASGELAKPDDVRDYLVVFKNISVPLLEYCVNMVDNNGNTVMHYAVSHGNFGVVAELLDSKVCNVNQMNNAGYTCVMLVSLAKLKDDQHRTVAQRLFQMSDVNIRAKKHCQTALMLAVSHGNLEMAEMLLAAGADINVQDEDGSTALMCAAEHDRIDIVKLLLSQADCDSLKQDVDGSTAFRIAWQAGHRDIGLLLYMHEQMLRSKLPPKCSGDSSGSHTPLLSPRNHKRQPSQ